MITLRPNDADTADLMFLERRVPFGWALAGLVFGGNIASAVLMLIGQGLGQGRERKLRPCLRQDRSRGR